MTKPPIAVIGIGCRFPGAPDEQTFFQNIVQDVCSIAPMPDARFNRERYFDPEMGAYGKSYCDLGGLIDEHPFDARAFKMPPKVVASTDIAHLWALEVARTTFENAGFDPFQLTGQNVGVVVGHARGSMLTADIAFSTAVEGMLGALDDVPRLKALGLDQLTSLKQRVVDAVHARYPKLTEDGGPGTIASALAGLITNTFGLTGRHMVVDAACASSLAALDIGIKGLQQGKLDAALVGGASYSQEMSVIMFAQSRALSPDGSFPFDQRANGFISSDGIGFLLLKRLDDALRDGNKIRAVIRGVGGSCDGKGRALWAPRREGQILAMTRAYAGTDVLPGSIGMIEGHATSTPLGDRTEVEAIHEFFAEHRTGPMPVGSVKGNIGHAREAAGAAGLIKSILALEAETLPPTGNFRTPSDEIPWNEVAVEVLTSPRRFESEGIRRIGVDAFGIGGLNYHVVLEEAPPARRMHQPGQRLTPQTSARQERCDIAIVGMGGKLPKANDLETFWENLQTKKDLTSVVPPERWDRDIYYQAGERTFHRTYLDKGAFVSDFVADWRRYRVPPKLIERNDPLQFLLLESALDALDDAGIDVAKIDRERVSVQMGTVFGSDYSLELMLAIRALELAEVIAEEAGDPSLHDAALEALRARLPSINEDSSGSFSSSTLASRTAKTLDLMGPTYTVDAACGSSLASLEAACETLRDGVVDLAIYGGGDRGMRVQRYAGFCQFYSLTRGTPRPFDAEADGFLPGEGAGVCVLKRLEDAERDGDQIYAVIKGVGSSGNGKRSGLHKASADALARAMTRALDQGGVDARDIRLVECHGGGTPAGDRVEVEAVRRVYGESPNLRLGTAKANVGHTQGAAGVISMIKTALSTSRGTIPPMAGFREGHSDHKFDDSFNVNAEPEAFGVAENGRRYAGVSSMGLAGVNYHAVLEGRGEVAPEPVREDAHVVSVRAASMTALAATIARLTPSQLHQERTIGSGGAVVHLAARDEAEIATALETISKSGLGPAAEGFRRNQGIFVRAGRRAGADGVVCAFSGQGSQYPGMMKGFVDTIPACKAMLDRIDAWFAGQHRLPLSRQLLSGDPIPDDVFLIQAAVLAGDILTWTAIADAGVRPDIVTGHSFGDYAALVAAGAWSLESALDATKARAAAIEMSVEAGAMASVTASPDRVAEILAEVTEGYVTAANVNAPDQVVIAGDVSGLEAAERRFAEAKLETQRLSIPRAFHSKLMANAQPTLEAALAQIPIERPKLRYLSSIGATFVEKPEEIRARLAAQLIQPVDFIAQMKALAESGCGVLIECGPRGVLASLARRIDPNFESIASDDANRPGVWSVARVAAMLGAIRSQSEEANMPDDHASDAKLDVPEAVSEIGLLQGDAAERLLGEEGFNEFWERTRPSVISFVESLWETEKRHTQPPAEVQELDAATTAIDDAPEVARVPLDAPDREEVHAFVLAALCEESGYPPEIIEDDADLEADLGIDTVKQAQVLGRVRDQYGLRTDEKLSLRDFPSLGHVVRYVTEQLGKQAATAPKKSIVPLVDLRARKTAPKPPAPTPKSSAPVAVAAAAPTKAPPQSTIDIPAPSVRVAAGKPHMVRVLHLEGTAFEIGRQHGAALRDPILEVMERYIAYVGTDVVSALSDPSTLTALSALFDEPSLQELKGVGQEVGIDYRYLLAYNLDAALFPAFTPGCTQAVRLARSNGGRLLHASNEDSPLLLHLGGVHPRVVQVRRRTDGPHPSRKCVFFSLAGQICGVNGVTDAGLTVSSTTLLDGPEPEEVPQGLPHPQIVKRVLEGASSLDDAEQIVRQTNRAGRWSLLVSDATADAARYLEYDGASMLEVRAVSDVALSTNHSASGPVVGCTAPEHSLLRESRACELLGGASPVDVEAAKRALRDKHDNARQRRVDFATMNTVRRVDNVMSLVVEPAQGVLHVTDRVNPPGTAGDDVSFITIAYGEHVPTLPPRDLQPVAEREPKRGTLTAVPAPSERLETKSRGDVLPAVLLDPARAPTLEIAPSPVAAKIADAGLAVIPEVMRRHIVRAVVDSDKPTGDAFAPTNVLLIGDGTVTEAVAAKIRLRAQNLVIEQTSELARARLNNGEPFDTLGLILTAEQTQIWQLNGQSYQERRARALDAPFALIREFACRPQAQTLFAVTSMGGGLGFVNLAQGDPMHGGVVGLLKATRREFDNLRVQLLDVGPSESPELAAQTLLTCLNADAPRLEVGLLRGKRIKLMMAEARAQQALTRTALPPTWLVTGGARGVSAKMCLALAELYNPRFHLVGRQQALPPEELDRLVALSPVELDQEKKALLETMKREGNFTPIEWKRRCEVLDKAVEMGVNLNALRELGADVQYHAVDLDQRDQVARLLQDIDRSQRVGLIHGAGVEIAKPFEKKTTEIYEATLGGKVDGLAHLLALTESAPFADIVAFTSVSGRFGGHGQTDYSLANEAAARIVGAYRERHPKVRATAINWAAFDEVGLAARSSAKAFLERSGQAFMTPREGANHLIRELWAGLDESDVTICERMEALDLDRIMWPEARRNELLRKSDAVRALPLIDRLIDFDSEHTRVEALLEASDAFLDQHRMGATPILPAVVALELLTETARLSDEMLTIGEVRIETPLKIPEGSSLCVQMQRAGEDLRLTATTRRPDGVVLEPERTFVRAQLTSRRDPRALAMPTELSVESPYPYPDQIDRSPGARTIFHGPVFRCLRGVRASANGGVGRLVVPAVSSLVAGSIDDAFALPVNLLDGCLQAVGALGRIVHGVVALPAGFGRVDVSPRARFATGEEVTLIVEFTGRTERELHANLSVTSADGVLLSIQAYRAMVVPGL